MNIAQLVAKIKYHRDLYYNNQPEISDAEYDALEDRLRYLDPQNPLFSETGIPVDITPWEKANHIMFLNSLDKVKIFQEYVDWAIKHPDTKIIQEKLDGISIELIYEDYILKQAITRGDGKVGEDITRNVLKMKNVKAKINIESICLRAEIILKQEDFNKIDGEYSNLRNASSGISKRFDGTHSEYLTLLYYDCDIEAQTELEKIQAVEKLGLDVVPYQIINTTDQANDIYNSYIKKRPELNYDIDGLVIKVNDVNYSKKINTKNKNPKSQIAWKFPPYKMLATLVDIERSLKKGDTITPVAILEPVAVQLPDGTIHETKTDADVRRFIGAKITRATLNNHEWMTKSNVMIGDIVIVERANDVIPKIIGIHEKRGTITPKITLCPVCETRVEVIGKQYKCLNSACKAKDLDNLIVFVETHTKNIGSAVVATLYDHNLIKDPSDLYTLNVNDLVEIEGLGEKKAELIVSSFQAPHKMPLKQFLLGLNIPMVLGSTWDKILDAVSELTALQRLMPEEWQAIPSIGEITAYSLCNSFIMKHDLITKLLQYIEIEKHEKKTGLLTGKKFMLTGTLSQPRKYYQNIITDHGGTITSSITGIDYLLAGDNAGSKLAKAEKAGKIILSEEDFLKMI